MLYTELQYQWNQPQQIENDERIIFGGFGGGSWHGIWKIWFPWHRILRKSVNIKINELYLDDSFYPKENFWVAFLL